MQVCSKRRKRGLDRYKGCIMGWYSLHFRRDYVGFVDSSEQLQPHRVAGDWYSTISLEKPEKNSFLPNDL